MGLFDLLFGPRKNLTSEWIEEPWRELELDLSNYSLCGCKLSKPVNHLSFLGPTKYANRYKFKDDSGIERIDYDLYYPEKGIHIQCDENYSVLSIEVNFDDSPHNPYSWIQKRNIPKKMFSGKIILNNKAYKFSPRTSREEIKKIYGKQEPVEDDESYIVYENDDFMAELTFSDEGALQYIEINWYR